MPSAWPRPAIVVIIGATEGLHWEVAQLITGGHMDRVVFVFPPVTEDVLHERWRSPPPP